MDPLNIAIIVKLEPDFSEGNVSYNPDGTLNRAETKSILGPHSAIAAEAAFYAKVKYGANISVANREKAFNWLRENGLGDIIKNEISVSFGRNEDNKAADYAALAEERGFQPTQKLKVEPMTLKALVRERIEAGKELPTELFNVFVGNKTTIKRKQ